MPSSRFSKPYSHIGISFCMPDPRRAFPQDQNLAVGEVREEAPEHQQGLSAGPSCQSAATSFYFRRPEMLAAVGAEAASPDPGRD